MAEIRSVGALVEAHEKATNRLARMKEKYTEGVQRSVMAVSGVAGALSSGAIRGMGYAKIPRTDIDTDLALGGAALFAAVVGMGGKQADPLLAFGLGMASGSLSRGAETAVSQWRASH